MTAKKAKAKSPAVPRGIRNNNPGNIEITGDVWVGQVANGREKRYVTFSDPLYGIRAIYRVLYSYSRRGVYRLDEIIATWAPNTENNTTAYINHVAERLAVAPDAQMTRDWWPALAAAITLHENGQNPYLDELFAQALEISGV